MATKKHPPRRLTETLVAELAPDPGGARYVVRDTVVRGFHVEVHRTHAAYKLQCDLRRGAAGARRKETLKLTLGRVGELPLEKARLRASELLDQVRAGRDPREKERGVSPAARPAAALTVGEMYDQYTDDLRARECAERTALDVEKRLGRYLDDWSALPVADVKKSMARERHKLVTRQHGKRAANQAFEDFRAAFRLALRVVDDPDALGANPTDAVTWNKERRAGRVIAPEELPDWYARLQRCPSPLRRAMHELGLLSGLRPGKLVSLKRAWVRLDKRAISIPEMKSGREEFGEAFALPLSTHMAEVVRRALAASELLFPGSEYLFPTRSNTTGEVIATQVWKEKALPSWTGHVLRHTYRTFAQHVGVDAIDVRLLMDHSVPGVTGVYLHAGALFGRLLGVQERMSAELMRACGAARRARPRQKTT